MGGFFYTRKQAGTGIDPLALRRRNAARAAFQAKGLAPSATLQGEDFVIDLFAKRLVKVAQLVALPGGDFVAATGTLFYKRRFGAAALAALYEDHGAADVFAGLAGSFAVLIRKGGVLSCFSDYFGVYHLFRNADTSVVSSSLLAVQATLPQTRLEPQALYEYLFDSAVYGSDTPIRGVHRVEARQVLELGARPRALRKHTALAERKPPRRFGAQVDEANAELVDYFQMLRAAFGERMVLGFSGGYDSRLLLAAALAAGVRPHLFVGGPAGAADVRIASLVAEKEGLALAHQDSARLPQTPLERFADAVAEKHAYYDGLGIRGAVNDGEEYLWRCWRLGAGAELELNGGGGEIYRDFWKLPERSISARDFVLQVMEFKNRDKLAAVTPRFERERFREALEAKLRQDLGNTSGVFTREELAALYTVLRSSAFAGATTKEVNLLAHGLLPFAEPRIALPAYRIALRHKAYGRFQSEMLRRLNPRLAAYPTRYGHPFSQPAPLGKRLRESVDRHCRSVVPLPVIFAAYRIFRKRSQYNSAPWYYSAPYLDALFDRRDLHIAEYVDLCALGRLADPHILSRALTLELLLRGGAALGRRVVARAAA